MDGIPVAKTSAIDDHIREKFSHKHEAEVKKINCSVSAPTART